ncbi:molybdopterin dinucleotide binding domain-containing protein [Streptomyces actinomycinicus]|uniref:molybdopterin dinucleotide binding domain-containing protein n=1 Tax=Streptomyces actinomycinicus TaxID=1695166 RepID=UPI0035F2B8AB
MVTDYVPTDERSGPRFPLLLTTGRILSQYNVGAQTRRTANAMWHPEDVLEMHPVDAENRGLKSGDWVRLASRSGETTLRLAVTDRVAPGVQHVGDSAQVGGAVRLLGGVVGGHGNDDGGGVRRDGWQVRGSQVSRGTLDGRRQLRGGAGRRCDA